MIFGFIAMVGVASITSSALAGGVEIVRHFTSKFIPTSATTSATLALPMWDRAAHPGEVIDSVTITLIGLTAEHAILTNTASVPVRGSVLREIQFGFAGLPGAPFTLRGASMQSYDLAANDSSNVDFSAAAQQSSLFKESNVNAFVGTGTYLININLLGSASLVGDVISVNPNRFSGQVTIDTDFTSHLIGLPLPVAAATGGMGLLLLGLRRRRA